jgi:hypothetical protein
MIEAMQWVAVSAQGGVHLPAVRAAADGEGWRTVELHDVHPLEALDDAVTGAAEDAGGTADDDTGSATGIALHTDGYLYIVAADAAGVRARMAFGPIDVSEEGLDAIARSYPGAAIPDGWREEQLAALVAWSAGAPRTIDLGDLPLVVPDPREEVVRLFVALGLSMPARGTGPWTELRDAARDRVPEMPAPRKRRSLFRR